MICDRFNLLQNILLFIDNANYNCHRSDSKWNFHQVCPFTETQLCLQQKSGRMTCKYFKISKNILSFWKIQLLGKKKQNLCEMELAVSFFSKSLYRLSPNLNYTLVNLDLDWVTRISKVLRYRSNSRKLDQNTPNQVQGHAKSDPKPSAPHFTSNGALLLWQGHLRV